MANDLTRHLQFTQKYQDHEVAEILGTMDINEDGKVSNEELSMLMKKLNK